MNPSNLSSSIDNLAVIQDANTILRHPTYRGKTLKNIQKQQKAKAAAAEAIAALLKNNPNTTILYEIFNHYRILYNRYKDEEYLDKINDILLKIVATKDYSNEWFKAINELCYLANNEKTAGNVWALILAYLGANPSVDKLRNLSSFPFWKINTNQFYILAEKIYKYFLSLPIEIDTEKDEIIRHIIAELLPGKEYKKYLLTRIRFAWQKKKPLYIARLVNNYYWPDNGIRFLKLASHIAEENSTKKDIFVQIASIYKSKSDFEAAKGYYEQIILLDPKNKTARRQLNKLKAQLDYGKEYILEAKQDHDYLTTLMSQEAKKKPYKNNSKLDPTNKNIVTRLFKDQVLYRHLTSFAQDNTLDFIIGQLKGIELLGDYVIKEMEDNIEPFKKLYEIYLQYKEYINKNPKQSRTWLIITNTSVDPETKTFHKELKQAYLPLQNWAKALVDTVNVLKQENQIQKATVHPNTKGRHYKLAEAAAKELSLLWYVKKVILFGSVAKGLENEESDIDLLIEGLYDTGSTSMNLYRDLDEIHKKLGLTSQSSWNRMMIAENINKMLNTSELFNIPESFNSSHSAPSRKPTSPGIKISPLFYRQGKNKKNLKEFISNGFFEATITLYEKTEVSFVDEDYQLSLPLDKIIGIAHSRKDGLMCFVYEKDKTTQCYSMLTDLNNKPLAKFINTLSFTDDDKPFFISKICWRAPHADHDFAGRWKYAEEYNPAAGYENYYPSYPEIHSWLLHEVVIK